MSIGPKSRFRLSRFLIVSFVFSPILTPNFLCLFEPASHELHTHTRMHTHTRTHTHTHTHNRESPTQQHSHPPSHLVPDAARPLSSLGAGSNWAETSLIGSSLFPGDTLVLSCLVSLCVCLSSRPLCLSCTFVCLSALGPVCLSYLSVYLSVCIRLSFFVDVLLICVGLTPPLAYPTAVITHTHTHTHTSQFCLME
jgi:hypothetical protein